MKQAILQAFILLIVAAGCAHVRQIGPEDAAGLQLVDHNLKIPATDTLTDSEIQTILDDNVGPGGQADALVVGLVDEKGARVISAGDNAGADILFDIGSITKVFTALLLEDMVQRGEMKLDDPVQMYLPPSVRMPTRGGKQITLFDLATHTSGLPREGEPGCDDSPQSLYAYLSRCRLRSDPGATKEYSNLGMGLLGHVIELKSGKGYETLLVERICRPLGMDSTRITLTQELKARRAKGHAFPGRPLRDSEWSGPLAGCGALHSTAADLLKFVSANLGLTASPLTPLMQKAQVVHRLDSGRQDRLAWVEDAGVLVHGGGTDGFRTNLAFNPSTRRGCVILANCGASRIPVGMMGVILKGCSPRPAETVRVDDKLLDDYLGQYDLEGGASCTVRRDDARLLLQVWLGRPRYPMSYPTYEVFPQSRTVFFNQMWDSQVTFVRDRRGRATGMIFADPREGVQGAIASRTSGHVPAPYADKVDTDGFGGFVGQYRAAILGLIPVGPTLNVYRKHDEQGEHLMAYVPGLTDAGEIYPFTAEAFFNPSLDDTSLSFRRNKTGKATGVNIRIADRQISAVRVSNQPRLPSR